VHGVVFIATFIAPVLIGTGPEHESILYLIFALPFYYDFPVAWLVSSLYDATGLGEGWFLVLLLAAGSAYWFLIGKLVGRMARRG
jgi:hypothetical protein